MTGFSLYFWTVLRNKKKSPELVMSVRTHLFFSFFLFGGHKIGSLVLLINGDIEHIIQGTTCILSNTFPRFTLVRT